MEQDLVQCLRVRRVHSSLPGLAIIGGPTNHTQPSNASESTPTAADDDDDVGSSSATSGKRKRRSKAEVRFWIPLT